MKIPDSPDWLFYLCFGIHIGILIEVNLPCPHWLLPAAWIGVGLGIPVLLADLWLYIRGIDENGTPEDHQ